MAAFTIETLAFRLWQERNCPLGDDQRDLFRAELILEQYPCYLAHQAEHNLSAAIKATEKATQTRVPSVPMTGVVVLALLDGSTEAMEASFERVFLSSPFNGAKPTPALTAGKELCFRQFCHQAMSDAACVHSCSNPEVTGFPYRDACIATFPRGGDGVTLALSSAVRLVTALADFNQSQSLHWEAQVHARISIAETVPLAISNARYSRRDNLILAPSLAETLSSSELLILRAVGLRSGSSELQSGKSESRTALISNLLNPAKTRAEFKPVPSRR